MFDGSVSVESDEGSSGRVAWREVDRQLRVVAKRRSALDREELELIRKAIALVLWRELGMVSMREYLEKIMGYGPNVASERIRVAEALDAMPALEKALETNVLPFSAVRAITRIATRKTERAWIAACRGKNLRQIEELLAEREPGDRPEDPRRPDLRRRRVSFELEPQVEVSPAVLERAACDAEWLGNVDGPRARAVQDVTPAVRKLVLARDGHRCRVPGCRSAQNIDVHHIVHRWLGGSHDPSNLIALCSGHHAAHHEGRLTIRGTADALEVIRMEESDENFHVENPDENATENAKMRTDSAGSGHPLA